MTCPVAYAVCAEQPLDGGTYAAEGDEGMNASANGQRAANQGEVAPQTSSEQADQNDLKSLASTHAPERQVRNFPK
ncbi:hypothetical protein D9M68_802430 [compost metagenome]